MDDDINRCVPSLLNPRGILKELKNSEKTLVRRSSFSFKRNAGLTTRKELNKINTRPQKENKDFIKKIIEPKDIDTLGYSAIEDLDTKENNSYLSSEEFNNYDCDIINDNSGKSDDTIIYNWEKPVFALSFKFENSKNVNVGTINTNIKNFSVSHDNDGTNITCKLIEDSSVDLETETENMPGNGNELSPVKKQTVAVDLEIKRERVVSNNNITEEQNVLILNTNAIDKLSHVIVQPPNYKFVKRDVSFRVKSKTDAKTLSGLRNGKISVSGDGLKQTTIYDYLYGKLRVHTKKSGKKFIETVPLNNSRYAKNLVIDDVDMSKNSSVTDTIAKCDKIRASSFKVSRENDMQSKARLCSPKRDGTLFRQQDLKASSSEVPRSISPKLRNGSISSYSPRKNLDSIHFSLPSKTRSNNKTNTNARSIPFYKIVAGTHFAVDAFSYGDIPNVNIYFLTHFHSDHYSGLKRTFNKTLYCSKITADLCVARLGVNPKHLQILNIDDTIKIEGIEVTAVDANHCPGAIMLIFTLPNGKNLLHTGDFRASPFMESYPVFWNKDMHTIYLDTTYCNPRYDFPTQDQSLEMALNLLRDKKTKLEEAGKKFSSVLIVCGAYTIGKEKFFLGIARRAGCLVWACPEKDRVLQVVEGQSFGRSAPHSCQLHVVPMRELTHEKLRAHLDSLQGAFSEVVAFKPSGWENDKTTAVTRDCVTIHGIPYSEHSSFSELIRFVKFLKPKQVVPTVDISGGVKTVQELCDLLASVSLSARILQYVTHRQLSTMLEMCWVVSTYNLNSAIALLGTQTQFFPCPLVYKEDLKRQSRLTDYFSAQAV